MLASSDRQVALEVLARRLSQLGRDWWVDGDVVRTKGTTVITVDDVCSRRDAHPNVVHIDVFAALNPARPEATIVDCASGWTQPREKAVEQAIDAWFATTAPVILTFLARGVPVLDASHVPSTEPGGVPGWHTIVGPMNLFGVDSTRDLLTAHVLAAPPLPQVAAALTAFDKLHLNGIKLFVGSTEGQLVAEVQVNHKLDLAASQALFSLPWPKLPGFWTFRQFAIALNRQ